VPPFGLNFSAEEPIGILPTGVADPNARPQCHPAPYPARVHQQSPLPIYTRNAAQGHDALLNTEWLLTSGQGGYAMGTALGLPTRRYHALLVAAMSPPVQREVMLSSLFESVIFDPGTARERTIELSTYRFKGGYEHPAGWIYLQRFEKGSGCRWTYRIHDVAITKTVHLYRDRPAVAVTYGVQPGSGAGLVRLQVRPMLAMRDAYGLVRAGDEIRSRTTSAGSGGGFGEVIIHGINDHVQINRWGRGLQLTATNGRFHASPQWWYDFEYEHEKQRGLDHLEDLFSPGYFVVQAGAAASTGITITAWLGEPPPDVEQDAAANRRRLTELLKVQEAPAGPDDRRVAIERLIIAADDFIVRRRAPGGGQAPDAPGGVSIIAGYPWFSDWGRDSMISLPGLLLCTRRHAEARQVLETFARHRRRGLIPNLFHDHSGAADYNTLDGSLWFLHAACEYLRASGDRAGFAALFRPACLDIIDHYRRGTDFGIRMDDDGLITAGDATTQLTWMDARRDGVVFTPRHGKAVEINALWHHGLMSVAAAIEADDRRLSQELRALAARAAASFRAKFWNAQRGCCYDVLTPGDEGAFEPGAQIRPNQIFAVSLEHSPLEPAQRIAVVSIVRERLLTRHGLRTLDPADPAYRGRFQGSMFERDGAYHNGTVWPWLIGAYCEAVLRTGEFSAAARAEALAVLRPLIECLDGQALGQIPEVFDGEDTPEHPQQPGGCIAQAWSIAEVLRILMLLR
jgi:predicted glycogen debranching enzyme